MNMEQITCATTLSNYRWPHAWHVKDGENTFHKPLQEQKLAWIEHQGLQSVCIETMGGWSFRNKADAIQFVIAWS